MGISILAANKGALINYDNVASIGIQKEYMQYRDTNPEWNLVAYFPAVSSDVLTVTLGVYRTEERCREDLATLVEKIKSGEHNFIQIGEK